MAYPGSWGIHDGLVLKAKLAIRYRPLIGAQVKGVAPTARTGKRILIYSRLNRNVILKIGFPGRKGSLKPKAVYTATICLITLGAGNMLKSYMSPMQLLVLIVRLGCGCMLFNRSCLQEFTQRAQHVSPHGRSISLFPPPCVAFSKRIKRSHFSLQSEPAFPWYGELDMDDWPYKMSPFLVFTRRALLCLAAGVCNFTMGRSADIPEPNPLSSDTRR